MQIEIAILKLSCSSTREIKTGFGVLISSNWHIAAKGGHKTLCGKTQGQPLHLALDCGWLRWRGQIASLNISRSWHRELGSGGASAGGGGRLRLRLAPASSILAAEWTRDVKRQHLGGSSRGKIRDAVGDRLCRHGLLDRPRIRLRCPLPFMASFPVHDFAEGARGPPPGARRLLQRGMYTQCGCR